MPVGAAMSGEHSDTSGEGDGQPPEEAERASTENPVPPSFLAHQGVGHGAFVGMWAAPLCHLFWGGNLFILPFAYGFGMSGLRSWQELAALLSMLGTTVAYFSVYDVVAVDDLSLVPTLALAALVVVLLFIFCGVVGARVEAAGLRAWTHAQSFPQDVERSQRWEEKYFRRIRGEHGVDERAAGRWFGWWSVRLVLVLGLALWSALDGDSRAVPSLLFAITLFHLLVLQRVSRYHRRLKQERAELVVGRSERRPVLFLRPFALDALPIAPMDARYSLFKVMSWFDKRTFEEYLHESFEDIGPLIAIGRPGEETAALGAAREYADDATWRGQVINRAREAQLVIMELDASPGMQWELEHVVPIVGLQRILVVLPPGEDILEPRSSAWYERWTELRATCSFLPEVSEKDAAVVFDNDSQPMLIRNKSSIPATLDAVRTAWLQLRSGSPDSSSWSSGTIASPTEMVEADPPPSAADERSSDKPERQLVNQAAAIRALITRRAMVSGRDDPERVRLRQELARVYMERGMLTRALALQQDVIARRSKAEGGDGPLTLSALGDLGTTQRLMGDLAGFRTTAQRVVDGYVQTEGDESAATFAARTQLGLAMQELGEMRAARAMLEALLEGAGAQQADPEVLRRAQRLLGSVLTATGDYESAVAVLGSALEQAKQAHGDEHPDVMETMGMLADANAGLGEAERAASLGQVALAIAERTFGRSNPLTLKYLVNAARYTR